MNTVSRIARESLQLNKLPDRKSKTDKRGVSLIFQFDSKEYHGATAVEIITRLAADASGFIATGGDAVREFLKWSIGKFGDRLPPREMEISDRLDDEALARNHLLLLDEYRIGKLIEESR